MESNLRCSLWLLIGGLTTNFLFICLRHFEKRKCPAENLKSIFEFEFFIFIFEFGFFIFKKYFLKNT